MFTGHNGPAVVSFTDSADAGKSVLAGAVSERLKIPRFDRDDFKDIFFDTLG